MLLVLRLRSANPAAAAMTACLRGGAVWMETILGDKPWALQDRCVCMLGGDGEGLVVGNVSFPTKGRVVVLFGGCWARQM